MVSFKKKKQNALNYQLEDKSLKLKLYRKRIINAKLNKDNLKL